MPPSPAILPALPIAHLAKLEAPTKAGEYTSPNKASRRLRKNTQHKMWPKKNITQKRTQFHSFIKPTNFSRLQGISRCLTSPDFSSHVPRLASVASSRPRQRGHFASEQKKKRPLRCQMFPCFRCQKKTQVDYSIRFSTKKTSTLRPKNKVGTAVPHPSDIMCWLLMGTQLTAWCVFAVILPNLWRSSLGSCYRRRHEHVNINWWEVITGGVTTI